ncbi:MAG: alpha-ketoacid dehydrogenase subunit beta [Abditibacteriales bacterium]|nr:alpha-ketoacid dehydrogenase subunit beta [Abditibacteriales bacterium]
MPTYNLIQSVNHTLRHEMRRDERVVVLGEDVAVNGGVFRTTDGLLDEFGPDRVIDTPLAEAGIIATAIGMAMNGLRPVPEIQFVDFIFPAFDQIVNELAKMRYRTGGMYEAPLVIRSPYGGGIRGGHYHSQSPEAYFVHTAGLKVVIPSGPYEAKGLLLSSIRDPDPVLFLEPKRIYRTIKEEVPEEDYTIPLGKARVVREGTDVTVLAYGAMLHVCADAAHKAAARNIDVELIDLRTLLPFDLETILESVQKTGRVVIVHEAPKTCGFGAELVAQICERAILHLQAPPLRVCGYDTPFPYTLEDVYLPDAEKVLEAIEKTVKF